MKFKSLKRLLTRKKPPTPNCSSSSCTTCYPLFDHVPHRQYLEGNDYTSPEEHEDVLAFVRRATDHRSQLIYQWQDTISLGPAELMQQQKKMLTQEIYRLDFRVSEAQTILAPVRRLTFDALQEIFLRCLPEPVPELDGYYTTPSISSDSLSVAVTLSHVCKIWRSTALSLSALWSHLPTHRGVAHPLTTADRDQLPGICMMIERTRNMGLTFALNLPYIPSPFNSQTSLESEKKYVEGYVDPVISLLIEHSEQWENITLFNLTPNHISTLSKIKGRLTNLKNLHLYTYCSWKSADFASLMELLDGTSRLQGFVSYGFSRDLVSVSEQYTPMFPLQRLTNIEANFHSPDDLRDIAAACSDTLQTLKMSALSMLGQAHYEANPDPQALNPCPAYELPRLTNLHISCTTGSTFRYLSLPSLEHLTWDFAHNYYASIRVLPLCEMVSRSCNGFQTGRHHPLKNLYILGTLGVVPYVSKPECEEVLVSLFKLIPNLSTLHSPWPGFSVVRALTRTTDALAPHVLPFLELCTFTDNHTKWPPIHLTDNVGDLAKSINDFAASRCQYASVTSSCATGNSREGNLPKRLKSFQILLREAFDGTYLHRELLRPFAPNICKPSSTFKSLIGTLAGDVPGGFSDIWDPWSPMDPPVWYKDWHSWRSRVVRTFLQISALDLNIWTILETGWHFCLERLRMLLLNDPEFYRHHSFMYEIVRDLHEECIRKFDEQPWTQRWLLSLNNRVMLYIPLDDPIMSTSATSDIVYDRGRECKALQEAFAPLVRHINVSGAGPEISRYKLLGY